MDEFDILQAGRDFLCDAPDRTLGWYILEALEASGRLEVNDLFDRVNGQLLREGKTPVSYEQILSELMQLLRGHFIFGQHTEPLDDDWEPEMLKHKRETESLEKLMKEVKDNEAV